MDLLSKKGKTYLDEHRGERDLERLASAVGASPFHLQRRFKEAFGVSPRDYQDAHRVRGGEVVAEERQPRYRRRIRRRLRIGVALLREAASRHERTRLPCRRTQATHHVLHLPSALGTVLVATTEKGVCSVKLATRWQRLLIDEFGAAELGKRKCRKRRVTEVRSRSSKRDAHAPPARYPRHRFPASGLGQTAPHHSGEIARSLAW